MRFCLWIAEHKTNQCEVNTQTKLEFKKKELNNLHPEQIGIIKMQTNEILLKNVDFHAYIWKLNSKQKTETHTDNRHYTSTHLRKLLDQNRYFANLPSTPLSNANRIK